MLALCLLGLVLAGERERSYDDLLAGLSSGRVHAVEIEGAMGGAGGLVHDERGGALVHLHWRDGWRREVTTVAQRTSPDEVDPRLSATDRSDRDAASVIGRVDSPLRERAPGVRLTWTAGPDGMTSTVWGWTVAGPWAGFAALLVGVLYVAVVAVGPEPALATRWAWTWPLMTPLAPLVVAAYVLVGARGSRRGSRRLTGGWALLLLLLVNHVSVG